MSFERAMFLALPSKELELRAQARLLTKNITLFSLILYLTHHPCKMSLVIIPNLKGSFIWNCLSESFLVCLLSTAKRTGKRVCHIPLLLKMHSFPSGQWIRMSTDFSLATCIFTFFIHETQRMILCRNVVRFKWDNINQACGMQMFNKY